MKNWNFRLKTGVFILGIFLILGFILPLFHSGNPTEWGTYPKNLKPSSAHFFGTTNLGQDTFWLLAKSIQNSFIIGIMVAFFATVIGALLGLLAGFKGGFLDRLITLLTDSFIVIPSLPILILLGSLMKGRASLFYIALVLIIFNWPWPARQLRSMALSLSEREFINTAVFSGASTMKIIMKEIFPYVAGWSVANFVNTILVAIGSESGLAVIGMSSNEKATLGTMIYWANQHQAMLAGRWWWIGSPVIAIVLIFIALFLTMTGYQQYSALRRGK
ncbi:MULTISPECIES: ABC transporter permease [Paenibacillus]|uniref:ABC transporter permease subunit n=1 Tax=Paenibacillus germinis TaxID=2654979 RepID=A0ABX1Z0A9_9BACL|nr:MULTISPECIES: ABC transporter permease [Paenibacillus]KQX62666.1 peptide ABC transporter permease [Paenibacillus sp. Root444D2]KRE46376.1 peptide ABC transporter permease [Paenibacillus sp. Soil724D2]NOU85474.1 ABC transporter permease subunit [Paenibacillus germinis]